MEVFSIIAMILVSLFGYSAGITVKAGKKKAAQPILADIILVTLIWVIIISLRITLDMNRWFFLIVGLVLGIAVGYLAAMFRTFWQENYPQYPSVQQEAPRTGNIFSRGWKAWMAWSGKLGHFQNRIFIAIFFLTLFAPVAILVRLCSDPLNIKKKNVTSFWSPTEKHMNTIEDFRSQS